MANPSTTGPSGAGTEVLRRRTIEAGSAAETILTVGANHIFTIMNIIILNNDTHAETMDIFTSTDGSGSIYMVKNQAIGDRETFVFSDKFVMTATDVLSTWCSSSDYDVHVSYIDQEFA